MTTTTPPAPAIAAAPGLRDRRSNPLREGALIAGRDLLHWVREPWGFVFGLAFNLMLVLMFGFLFGGAIEVPGDGDYIAFLLPGMFALAMLFGLESTMTAMAEDSKRGITDRFRSLPIASALGGARPRPRRPGQLGGRPRRAHDRRTPHRLASHHRPRRDRTRRGAAALAPVRPALGRDLPRPPLPGHRCDHRGAGARLADRLPLDGVRVGRDHARVARRDRRVEPRLGDRDGGARAVRQPHGRDERMARRATRCSRHPSGRSRSRSCSCRSRRRRTGACGADRCWSRRRVRAVSRPAPRSQQGFETALRASSTHSLSRPRFAPPQPTGVNSSRVSRRRFAPPQPTVSRRRFAPPQPTVSRRRFAPPQPTEVSC